jgi:hypothetical protein
MERPDKNSLSQSVVLASTLAVQIIVLDELPRGFCVNGQAVKISLSLHLPCYLLMMQSYFSGPTVAMEDCPPPYGGSSALWVEGIPYPLVVFSNEVVISIKKPTEKLVGFWVSCEAGLLTPHLCIDN